MERTLVFIKPDGVHRGLLPQVTQRIQQKGYRLDNIKMTTVSDELARTHYQHLKNKPFFETLVKFMKSGPVIAMIWTGKNVVEGIRQLTGATDGLKASPGSIRGDFATDNQENIVHASDSAEAAEMEIKRFFG